MPARACSPTHGFPKNSMMPARVRGLPSIRSPLLIFLARAPAALVLFLLSAVASAEDFGVDTGKMLGSMAAASRTLDYQGIFTYEYAGVLRSVQVSHVTREGVEYERWYYLNGPRQEILRHGETVGCAAGLDSAPAVIAARPAIDYQRLASHYELHVRGEDRVADRPVWVIHLVPRDLFRYGYVFAIDKESGLLLQSLLLDAAKRVLERFQYMHVTYGVATETADHLIAAATSEGIPAVCGGAGDLNAASSWELTWLPPGFRLMGRDLDEQGVETLLFSDGLSVFSVFFDPEGDRQLPEVQAQRGATVAQLARVNAGGRDYLVSVVGEIPIETAQRVAELAKHTGEQ